MWEKIYMQIYDTGYSMCMHTAVKCTTLTCYLRVQKFYDMM